MAKKEPTGSDFILVHDAKLPLPVAGINRPQRIVGQQAVFRYERRYGSGAVHVENRVVAYAEAAGNEKLHAVLGKEPGLHFRIAHGFVVELRLHLLQPQLFFRDAAGLAADAVKLEALLPEHDSDLLRQVLLCRAERRSAVKLRRQLSILKLQDIQTERQFAALLIAKINPKRLPVAVSERKELSQS